MFPTSSSGPRQGAQPRRTLPRLKVSNNGRFNPRTGTAQESDTLDNRGTHEFAPPSQGFGSDWVLVLDDAGKGAKAPGA